jgi:uncharacterized protein YyaL (SSP411 family)
MDILINSETGKTGELLDSIDLKAFNQFESAFDNENGGFGTSPKFPSPHNLLFLLRYWRNSGNATALEMVEKTLNEMRKGGIYDHVGFGFHRYSTDSLWRLPHFEKMLYDQAMLSMAYLEVFQATNKPEYAETVREVFKYVLRDLTHPSGGFYSAEDADSEGKEGKFYVWTLDELSEILNSGELELISGVYNFENDGNFRDESLGRKTGENIVFLRESIVQIARKRKIPYDEFKSGLNDVLRKMYNRRKDRIHPLKDDKILTDWNGLMIAALAMGGRILDDNEYTKAAEKAAKFVLENIKDKNKRLLHRYRTITRF